MRESQPGAIDTAQLLIQRDVARPDWLGGSDRRTCRFHCVALTSTGGPKDIPIRYRFWVGRSRHVKIQAHNKPEVS